MAGCVSRVAGEPPPCKQCKCGADIDGLSEYHLKKHLEEGRDAENVLVKEIRQKKSCNLSTARTLLIADSLDKRGRGVRPYPGRSEHY